MADRIERPAELGDPDRPVWHAESMVCAVCSHRWMAVFPCCAPALECPGCGLMNAKPPCGRGMTQGEAWNADG